MRIKILLSALTFILVIMLSGYIHLPVSAGRRCETINGFHKII